MIENIEIVPLSADVLDPVFRIEQVAGDTRWSRFQFEKELDSPTSRFFVLKRDRNILGYGGYWKVGPEAQIVNLAVIPEQRRQGNGLFLVSYLLGKARAEGCQFATLEVRKNNQAAVALYGKAGFLLQGTRPQRYTDPPDDAILMEKQF